MKKTNILILVLFLIILSLSAYAGSVSTTFSDFTKLYTDVNYTYAIPYNTSIANIGVQYTPIVDSFYWTDSSSNTGNCTETARLQYRAKSTDDWSATAWYKETEAITGLSLSAKQVRIQFNITTYETYNCSITGLGVNYETGLSDVISGMPVTGTYIGSFLTNLAPGVGAFIIVMGVFIGVVGIITSVIFIVKDKFMSKK